MRFACCFADASWIPRESELPRGAPRGSSIPTVDHDNAAGSACGSGDCSDRRCRRNCLTDFDGGGIIGILDLLALLASWGPCPDPCLPCTGDLNGDCVVDAFDLAKLLADWCSVAGGNPCGTCGP